MVLKFLPVAILSVAVSTTAAMAQGRPPAEIPPADFVGQQYVDSRGCLYIRAGHGGQVNWVARIDRARKPICGQAPTANLMANAKRDLAAPQVAAVTAAAAPAAVAPSVAPPAARAAAPKPSQYTPPPVRYGKPTPLSPAASAHGDHSGRDAVPAPVRRADAAPMGGSYGHWPQVPGWPSDNNNQINPQGVPAQGGVLTPNVGGHPPLRHRSTGCPADAPFGKIYDLADGRNIMLCATKPHQLQNLSETQARGIYQASARGQSGQATVAPVAQSLTASADLTTPPKGYKAAWQDDRLNTMRGPRGAHGDAQQARVWTNEVPAELQPAPQTRQSRRVASSKSVAPLVAPVAAGRFVQVGSFANPENVQRAVARLQGMGLPVQISRGQIKGKPVQIVRAGPFASPAEASQALNAARQGGFADAVLRR